jgi:hypothetical protein
VILTRVKRLLQSVEEASPHQIAADLGVDLEIATATLEHLRATGRVVVRRRPKPAPTGEDDCTSRIGCASCPLVPVCGSGTQEATEPRARPTVYSWVENTAMNREQTVCTR